MNHLSSTQEIPLGEVSRRSEQSTGSYGHPPLRGCLSARASGAFLCNCAIFSVFPRELQDLMCNFNAFRSFHVQELPWPNDRLAQAVQLFCAKIAHVQLLHTDVQEEVRQ
jgi:hypothetical protein